MCLWVFADTSTFDFTRKIISLKSSILFCMLKDRQCIICIRLYLGTWDRLQDYDQIRYHLPMDVK